MIKPRQTGLSPHHQAVPLAMKALTVLMLAAGLLWLTSNIRQIPPDSTAVVFRFGAISRVADAGLLLALPEPFETVTLLPSPATILDRSVETLQRSTAARDRDSFGGTGSDAEAGSGYLLTGDASTVQLSVHIYYRVSNPAAYALQRAHVPALLDRIVARTALAIAAGRDLDAILVARPELVGAPGETGNRREQLKFDLLAGIRQRLQALSASGREPGIAVERADLQSALPAPAVAAFNQVLTASQEADRDIAAARNAAEQIRQAATQQADRRLKTAEASGAERIARARADTAEIAGLTSATGQGRDPATLTRLYRDRIGAVLSSAGTVITVDPKDDARLILQGEQP